MDKEHISVAIIGHVKSGKSTVAANLLYKCGSTESDKPICELNRNTIRTFETMKYTYTMIDTPGNRNFIKNMITGTSQADVALLVVSALPSEFKVGASQTREHALLAFTFGIKQMIVAVNKIDAVDYAEERFNEVKDKTNGFLKNVGYDVTKISVIPVTGSDGDNLIEPSEKIDWYKGQTLLEALDEIKAPRRNIDKPLRFPIRDVYKIGGVGTVVVGRVETGTIKTGMPITFSPSGVTTRVKSIEMHYETVDQANAGDIVGLHIENVLVTDVRRGDVCSDPRNKPAKEIKNFTAQIIVLNHPGHIKVGYTPVIDCHTSHTSCKFTQIVTKNNRRTGEEIEKEPESIKMGDSCVAVLTPVKPLCVEAFSECAPLGRFAIRDQQMIVAVGVVKSVEKK